MQELDKGVTERGEYFAKLMQDCENAVPRNTEFTPITASRTSAYRAAYIAAQLDKEPTK